MKYNRLGTSDLVVSEVCLGSMTWGLQNSEEEAHAQIAYAVKRGVNFIDTAEMYPVPPSHPAYESGRTEQIIGKYLAAHPQQRANLIVASKVIGYVDDDSPVGSTDTVARRSDPPTSAPAEARLDAASIQHACQASLRRLRTTYIDLYQVHWPDRYVPLFGKRGYDATLERTNSIPISDTLRGLKKLLDDGCIRAYGVSNETAFGVCEWCRLADDLHMPRPASIQSPFCLLDRRFEGELAEACAPRNLNIGLLPWSILAGGALTGAYSGDAHGLLNASFSRFDSFYQRYGTPTALRVVDKYAQIAKRHGLSVATVAQAFCKSRWFITSSIVGATTMRHLEENIDAFDIELGDDILQEIDDVHNENLDVAVSF